jgi:ADP-heptose:LPS heptosyltransferase
MMNGETSVEKPKWLVASDAAQAMTVDRVAWIRVGALGDLLVAMACLKEMENFFPKAKVTVFGPKLWLELLDSRLWKNVDSVVVIVDGENGQKFTPNEGTWITTGEPPQKLSEFMKGCQVSVNLRVESLRYAWPALFAGVTHRFGTCEPSMRWLYSQWSPWLGKDPIIHERDRMLEILEVPKGFSLQSFL